MVAPNTRSLSLPSAASFSSCCSLRSSSSTLRFLAFSWPSIISLTRSLADASALESLLSFFCFFTEWLIKGPEDDGPEDDGPEDDGPEDDGPENDGPEDDGPEDDEPEDDGPKVKGQRMMGLRCSHYCLMARMLARQFLHFLHWG